MKKYTKSSITLPPNELKLVEDLMKSLGAKSKVEVIRRSLNLLKETTDRKALRSAYASAAAAVRKNTEMTLQDLDDLTDEGLD